MAKCASLLSLCQVNKCRLQIHRSSSSFLGSNYFGKCWCICPLGLKITVDCPRLPAKWTLSHWSRYNQGRYKVCSKVAIFCKVSRKRRCRVSWVFQIRFSAIILSFSAIQISFSAIQIIFLAIQIRFSAINLNFSAINLSFSAINLNFSAINLSFSAINLNFSAINFSSSATNLSFSASFWALVSSEATCEKRKSP